jgi:hypothetical protein
MLGKLNSDPVDNEEIFTHNFLRPNEDPTDTHNKLIIFPNICFLQHFWLVTEMANEVAVNKINTCTADLCILLLSHRLFHLLLVFPAHPKVI